MRKYFLFLSDVAWLGVSPIIAIFVRDNFELTRDRLDLIEIYVILNMACGVMIFLISGVHRGLWRYASLADLLKVTGSAAVAILIALFLAFHLNRLEGLPRSIPLIQWFVMVAGLCATRVAARLAHGRSQRSGRTVVRDGWTPAPQNVLVIGLNPVAELYLGAAAQARDHLVVKGILAEGKALRGRHVKLHRILGAPEDLLKVLAEYETHGVVIDRVALAASFEDLSPAAREALLKAERMGVTLDFFAERLGLIADHGRDPSARGGEGTEVLTPDGRRVAGWYGVPKRVVDVFASAILAVAAAPIACVVALLVALDVGAPIVFWQQRPGRYGRQFKLYKFRTMAPAHDAEGVRVPEEQRSSRIGKFLRRTRLDELPQLYNILMGDMSFVGPRPLLASEQTHVGGGRLLVRPGLTGWAQINGGREVSIKEKAALDMWYVKRMSPRLDAMILLGTVSMLINGDRRNGASVQAALDDAASDSHDGTRGEATDGRDGPDLHRHGLECGGSDEGVEGAPAVHRESRQGRAA